jgi:hypothetical protein
MKPKPPDFIAENVSENAAREQRLPRSSPAQVFLKRFK